MVQVGRVLYQQVCTSTVYTVQYTVLHIYTKRKIHRIHNRKNILQYRQYSILYVYRTVYCAVHCITGLSTKYKNKRLCFCAGLPFSGQCTPCSKGTYSNGATSSCIPCLPGTHAASKGSSTCQLCDQEYYSGMILKITAFQLKLRLLYIFKGT